jgi:sec-independent protein translocase protein TatB
MLDVGFSEILLTSAIALIVLGPERLPKVARQVGNWMGRARAMARQLSEQLEREVSADELLKQQTKTSKAAAYQPAGTTAIAPPLVQAAPLAADSAQGTPAPPEDASRDRASPGATAQTTVDAPPFAAAPAPVAAPPFAAAPSPAESTSIGDSKPPNE